MGEVPLYTLKVVYTLKVAMHSKRPIARSRRCLPAESGQPTKVAEREQVDGGSGNDWSHSSSGEELQLCEVLL